MLEGIFAGFAMWWIPYLYIWTILWGAVMLLPRDIPKERQRIVYAVTASAHGFLFGTLYAPLQALMFGLDFRGMIAWIIAGIPFDCIHGVSNFCLGLLCVPLIRILRGGKAGSFDA
jgi:energy-coupling factor transport system substrate-specific component